MGSAERVFVGLDIGGTQVKAGAIHEREFDALDAGSITDRTQSIETSLDRGVEDLIDRLVEFALSLGANATLGVGCPGVFEQPGGRLLRSANLQPLEGLDLPALLAARAGWERSRVRIENDANLATYGEQWLGAGRDSPNMVMLTLGTGIGSGLVLGDKLFAGPTGKAPELGHIIVRSKPSDEPDAPGLRCGCGAYGCLERLASAPAVMFRAEQQGLTTALKELAQAARQSDGRERQLLFEVGYDLGAGLLTATSALDVTCFVIGGGFGRALDVLQPGIDAALGERDYGHATPHLIPAQLGPAAGWIGAARLALDAEL